MLRLIWVMLDALVCLLVLLCSGSYWSRFSEFFDIRPLIIMKAYHTDPKFPYRQVWTNSVDPDQTALVWSGSTLFAEGTVWAGFTLFAEGAVWSGSTLFAQGTVWSGSKLFAEGVWSGSTLFAEGAVWSGVTLFAEGAVWSGATLFAEGAVWSGATLKEQFDLGLRCLLKE